MKKMACSYKTGYSLLLMFVFLFGAIPAMVYLPELKKLIPENETYIIKAMASLVLMSSMLVSSTFAIILLPVFCLVFGALSAVAVDSIRLAYMVDGIRLAETILFLVMLPVQFCVCSYGMNTSEVIRSILAKEDKILSDNGFEWYIIMLAGMFVYILVQCII